MKKSYMVGLVLILLFAVAMIAYGAWLNKSGEHQITERMENRTIPLQGAKVKVRDMHPTLFLETINLYSDEMADAVALIDGRIENIFVSKNSNVTRGQVIFTLVNDDIPLKIQQADSSIAKAEAQLANAKNNYARYTRLRERDATSVEKFDEAEAAYFASEAALKEAQTIKEQLLVQSARQDVTAPIDGEVLILYRQQGAYVTAGTPIALVGNFSHLFFSLPVNDKQARRISVGDRVELSFTNSKILRKAYDTDFAAGNRGDAQIFSVYVKEIVPDLNETASLRKIVFEIDNRVGLLEQQAYSGATLSFVQSRQLLTVPLAAMTDSNRNAVFVVTREETLERRHVKTGIDDGNYIEIVSGVNEGEIVVTSASEGLKDGMKVTVTMVGGDSR
ncbi:MAG: efflux RND transporter periplasmic adaptor subunit [Selenomonadaceae bacterium]|nr:efflux RND transporter periplasmic adaptor subunit [Selenomonadaceae bacterium]